MLRRVSAAPLARKGLSALAPRIAAVRPLHATGARFADDASATAGGLMLNFTRGDQQLREVPRVGKSRTTEVGRQVQGCV